MPVNSASLVNTTSIESPYGFRSINLFLGDICAARDELLAVSSHAVVGSEPHGSVIVRLEREKGIDFSSSTPMLTLSGVVGTYLIDHKPHCENPYKDILVTRIPGYSSISSTGGDPLTVYENTVWTLFGSVAALELKGKNYRSMAMPLLGGRRKFPLQEIMEVLLRHATRWLKNSQSMHSVNLYLYEEDQLSEWTEAMNNVLGRRLIDSAKHEIVRALRDEILARMHASGKFKGNDLQEVVVALENALKAEKICLQQVSAFSRALVERIVDKILNEREIVSKNNLQQDTMTLTYNQIVAPWIATHFHSLRVFGNETLHKKTAVSYKPTALQDDDLVPILSSLSSVVVFWCEW
jgi:hypothetical protein